MVVEGELEIDALIRQNRAFAVYRLPSENRVHFIEQTKGSVEILPAIESLNRKNGFVIAPFLVSETCPVVLIKPDEEFTFNVPDVVASTGKNDIIFEKPPYVYQSCFKKFAQTLVDKEFKKLVLSHCTTIPRKSGFSPSTVFFRACVKYINSFVFFFHTQQTGTWIGSTPEILLSGKGNQWRTVAIAGTQSLLNGRLPEFWNEQKREEQQLVVEYIRDSLLSFNIFPAEKGPYTVQAGDIAHLRTDFHFSLSCTKTLGNILNVLHPTPAVCGLPKEKAFRFINENEGYDRRYYTGFTGRIHPEEQTDLYVNLRCMQIEENNLLLYAGGGLLASSVMQEEWVETENKYRTMGGVIE